MSLVKYLCIIVSTAITFIGWMFVFRPRDPYIVQNENGEYAIVTYDREENGFSFTSFTGSIRYVRLEINPDSNRRTYYFNPWPGSESRYKTLEEAKEALDEFKRYRNRLDLMKKRKEKSENYTKVK